MPRTSAEALTQGELLPCDQGTLSVNPFMKLFVKGIREQFNPGLSLEVAAHQKGIVFLLYPTI